MKRKPARVNNVIVVSDLHCGCGLGLCPPLVRLDEGQTVRQSPLQAVVWAWWREFWGEWVPMVTQGEPFAVVVNGDALEGRHHGATTQLAQNLEDQARIARTVLQPIVNACEGRYYHIRGTEAHAGPAGEAEEELARSLGAIPSEHGHHARYELWLSLGAGLAHLTHHIGTTGSSAYETTALCKEYSEACSDAARWHRPAPDVVGRSHRHRHAEVRVPTKHEYGICFVTAGWQLKTPLVFRIPGGRVTMPQIGGSLIRAGDHDVYTRHKTWEIERSKTEVI